MPMQGLGTGHVEGGHTVAQDEETGACLTATALVCAGHTTDGSTRLPDDTAIERGS